MKQVLIYLHKNSLKPIGGPLGYNYNLFCQLKNKGYTNIHFIESANKADSINKKINNIKINWLKQVLIIAKSIYKKTVMLYGFKHKSIIDLSPYDIVHFHSTMDMFNAKDDLKNYKGKVVLTTHSPTLLSKEIYDRLSLFEKKYLSFLYKALINIDLYAFQRADYIIFPCEDAEEPYYHNWDGYANYKQQNRTKYRYLLTGINPCYPQINKEDIRKKYNIPPSAFIICYVGRHNEIKGYDTLLQIGEMLLNKHDNIYILVAGKEEPMKGLAHPHWIEVGWTNDPYSLINACDIFLLPNKETYFDLVMLEVLSLGKIIVTSRTGGNKFFEKLEAKGIKMYNNSEEAICKIEKIMAEPLHAREILEKSNQNIYQRYFTASTFTENYVKLINSL